jgi:sucrose-6F-phosphate phosphohydrolase
LLPRAQSVEFMSEVRLVCSDLDGTLIGNRESALRFQEAWDALPSSQRPYLCYNTGRLIDDALMVVDLENLPRPDYVLAGVGTQIWDASRNGSIPGFHERFGQGWDLARIERLLEELPSVLRQPAEFLHPYKSSWFLNGASPEALASIEEQLRRAGLDVVVVYSGQRFLDVLPRYASKGKALTWLAKHLGIPPGAILVAGDSGNDSGMFRLRGVRGILVENAQPELLEATVGRDVYTANGILAEGVLDGLRHYGVIHRVPMRPLPELGTPASAPSLFRPGDLRALTQADVDLVREGYRHAIEALRRNITPLGFSAASLDDNATIGTDENYRSVWARDGSITVIQSLFLDDPVMRTAQRTTLLTLLDRVGPAGQLPSNVRIDSREADYSGVGRIASIDSGLWVIIALYNFVNATGEVELVERYRTQLERAMTWLTAQDSNSDGLLEIPEAGDWTDLFGHSYNVLYDETLWYRALVCFGKLLELLREHERAAEFFRASQRTRAEILKTFWPQTKIDPTKGPPTFADQQFSLGDTRYLIARVSPFGFSWRCDVWGNILAFLFNIVDVARARTAFEFMWGVGVNQPYPVKNLYPSVITGDPDWRSYFAVNLLNLPGHYHNGGIWPHIGGMWVRYIHRLGMRELACRELVRLAELNKTGIRSQWEFNEWAHAQTGRPMGKRFQAWSAAAYLRACHELELVVDETEQD